MKRILHIITGLDRGGAETTLQKLLTGTDRTKFAPQVLSLTSLGEIGTAIAATGIPVTALDQRRGLPGPASWLRLVRAVRAAQPDLIQTWLYHADLLGGVAGRLLGIPVVWNIRSGRIDSDVMKRSTIATIHACAWMSHVIPGKIVACSDASGDIHARLHYASRKFEVIPNGYDLDVFRPDPAARQAIRSELGLTEETPLVGLIGRFDPLKNHGMFLHAAAMVRNEIPGCRFLLCGSGIDYDNEAIASLVRRLDLERSVHLLGERKDVPQVMAALDLSTLTSTSEGFPNVVAESMACGVPCIVTNVGESAAIVGDTGRVVASGDSEALARCIVEFFALSPDQRHENGVRARERVRDLFSIETTVKRYENLYDEIIDSRT